MKDNKIHTYRTRTNILLTVFLIILFLVLGRFFYLQIIQGNELKALREQNINAFEYIYPKRGRILSRDGVVLAEDRKIFSLAVDIEQKPSEESIEILSTIFSDQIQLNDLKDLVSNSLRYRKSEIVIDKISQQDLAKYLVRGSELRGFSVVEGYER